MGIELKFWFTDEDIVDRVPMARFARPADVAAAIDLAGRDVLDAGCGIGIAMSSLLRTVRKLELNQDDVVVVSGIGCAG